MEAAEDKCNNLIRECKNVSVELLKDKSQLRAGCKELPDDFAGPIRVVNIDGVDQNMCCGTHVTNLSHVQVRIRNSKFQSIFLYYTPPRNILLLRYNCHIILKFWVKLLNY